MKKELFLKENPTLRDFQLYAQQVVEDRGYENETIAEVFMLLSEEVGEMAKAIRQSSGMKVDKNSHIPNLDLETADVFILTLMICNYFDIDLEKAFRDKEEINKLRKWEH